MIIHNANRKSGFTLIELSIVLVIIGLIVGGVLVGRDLINAAVVRSQISQIEQYNTAVNTFRLKYDYLPGDMPEQQAISAGLLRTNTGCHNYPDNCGDGDGRLGIERSPVTEERLFWLDLSTAGLIPNSFLEYFYQNHSTDNNADGVVDKISDYLPPAKIGGENYVYVYSGTGTYLETNNVAVVQSGYNYLGIVGVKRYCGYNICGDWGTENETVTAISVLNAYNIDQKIDDGLPMTGNVRAAGYLYLSGHGGAVVWADGNYGAAGHGGGYGWNSTRPAAVDTCFDNNNNSGSISKYSVGFNGGDGLNCALSFKIQ